MAYLVLVRHGTSEYNAKGLWTGWADPSLNPSGVEEAIRAGNSLKDIHFDFGYTSALKRAQETLEEIKKQIGQTDLVTIENKALDERNYGDFTGKNKWQIKEQVGDAEFQKIRRGWDYPIPNGESLKQVYEREMPYFLSEIMPKLTDEKNIIIASSGNALRAIVKYLEHIADADIASLEFGLGEVFVYTIDTSGNVLHKEIRAANSKKGKI